MKGSVKRQELFDLYSQNLGSFAKSVGWDIGYLENGIFHHIKVPIYACPLCLEFFDTESLNQSGKNPLTLEDVPPKSLRGKPILLTCKNCNNTSGKELDIHLNLEMELSAFVKGGFKLKSKGKIHGGNTFKLATNFNVNDTTFQLIYSKKNPYAQRQIDYLASNWDKSKFTLEVSGPNRLKLQAALLRVAYLLNFSKFGYAYIFTESAKTLRHQIQNPLDKIISKPYVITSDQLKNHKGFHLLTEPKNLKCFVVVFALELNNVKKHYAVLTPGPENEHLSSFMNQKRDSSTKLSFSKIRDYDFIENATSYLQFWKNT